MVEKLMTEIRKVLERNLRLFLNQALNEIKDILKDKSSFITTDNISSSVLPPRKTAVVYTVKDLSHNTYEYTNYLSIKIDYSPANIADLKRECKSFNKQRDKGKWPIHYAFDKESKSWMIYADHSHMLKQIANYCLKFLGGDICDFDY